MAILLYIYLFIYLNIFIQGSTQSDNNNYVIMLYSVALLLAKSKSSDNLIIQTIVTSWHVLAELS